MPLPEPCGRPREGAGEASAAGSPFPGGARMNPLPLPSLSRGGGLPPTACGPATSKTPVEPRVSCLPSLTRNTEAGRTTGGPSARSLPPETGEALFLERHSTYPAVVC